MSSSLRGCAAWVSRGSVFTGASDLCEDADVDQEEDPETAVSLSGLGASLQCPGIFECFLCLPLQAGQSK